MRRYLFVIFTIYSWATHAQSRLTLEQCEALFQKNNLSLLAEQYNITASEAATIQAAIWDLPVASGELNLINPSARKVVDIGTNGQKALAVQQLIYLGGKKKNEVEFAKSNVELAKIQYEQLVRNLRFELQKSFFEMYFNQKKLQIIRTQLTNLDSLVTAYAAQAQKGNVPLKDLVRLQSLSIAFKNDLLTIQQENYSQQESLKLLTNTSENIIAIANDQILDDKLTNGLRFTENDLNRLNFEQNPDYRFTTQLIENNELMLKWQKSLTKPDLTLGLSYDQRGGAFANQTNLTVGMPIPFWNRNKGNIKVAEAQLEQSKIVKEQKVFELKTKILLEMQNYNYQWQQYQEATNASKNFELVNNGVLRNFLNRNLSLIEFTDFMESYNQSLQFITQLKKQIIISGEQLNFLTNENIF